MLFIWKSYKNMMANRGRLETKALRYRRSGHRGRSIKTKYVLVFLLSKIAENHNDRFWWFRWKWKLMTISFKFGNDLWHPIELDILCLWMSYRSYILTQDFCCCCSKALRQGTHQTIVTLYSLVLYGDLLVFFRDILK